MTQSPLPSYRALLNLLFPNFNNNKNFLKYWHRECEVSFWLSRSAWSLALIAQLRKKEKQGEKVNFWIPDYFCNNSLAVLRNTGCTIIFYPIQENLEPDILACKKMINSNNSPDIFLIVHYFGKPVLVNTFFEFCKRHNSWLVEDAAHVLRPVKGIGESGDFVLYSPHKLLPLPDGAVLVARPNGPSALQNNIIPKYFLTRKPAHLLAELRSLRRTSLFGKIAFSPLLWLCKKILQKLGITNFVKRPFYELSEENNDIIFKSPKISWLSLRILSKISHDLYNYALHRERNQMLWDEYFESTGQMNDHRLLKGLRASSVNWTPYLAMYKGDEKIIYQVYKELKPENFLPSTWPDLPPEVIADQLFHSIAIRLRHTQFFLPVHQTISKNHFWRLLDQKAKNINPVITKDIRTEWNQVTKVHWNFLMAQCNKPNLMQSWCYGEAKNEVEGWKANHVVFYSDDTVIAICQILEKRIAGLFTLYRVNRGPLLLSDNEYLNQAVITKILELGDFVKGKLLSVSLELFKTNKNTAFVINKKLIIPNLKGYSSVWIDLNLQLKDIRAKLDGKWRNMLVFAEKQSLSIESGSSQTLLDWICEVHDSNMKVKGFKGISSLLLRSLFLHTDKENEVLIYKACLQEIPIAAICVACTNTTATYLLGWTGIQGRQMKANYLLLWEAVRDLKEKKIHWFDLGGIDPEETPGITAFKSGMNGETYMLVPEAWKI